MKRKELLLILVASILLANSFHWLHAQLMPVEPREKPDNVRLTIEKVEKRPIVPFNVAHGYDTQIVAVLNYSGPKPNWWGENHSLWTPRKTDIPHLFFESNNKKQMSASKVMCWGANWNAKSQRYEAAFLLKLSGLPRRPEKTVLRANIGAEDYFNPKRTILSPAVEVAYTVRQPNEIIKPPDIKRDPQLQLKKVTIIKKKLPDGADDTFVTVELFDSGKQGEESDAKCLPDIVNERGESVNWGGFHDDLTFLSERRFTLECWTALSECGKSPNLFMEVHFSRHGRWPLLIRIPLRRNGKNLRGTVKATAQPVK
jgi:hypothetical protein